MTEETKPEVKQEGWIEKKWRPMMAIQYMVVCLSDFVLFPIMWTIVQFWETQASNDAFRQWAPMTLQGGGLYHMAMGAVLGITAWSRGQEKMAGVAGGSASVPVTPIPSTAPAVAATPPTNWQAGLPGTSAVDIAPQPQAGFGGKLAPPPAPQPLI